MARNCTVLLFAASEAKPESISAAKSALKSTSVALCKKNILHKSAVDFNYDGYYNVINKLKNIGLFQNYILLNVMTSVKILFYTSQQLIFITIIIII